MSDLPQLCSLTTYVDRAIFVDKEKFPVKITVKQHMGILAKIKKKLEDWELDIFRRSCFGHFLD